MTLLITGTLVPINEENSDGMMISMKYIPPDNYFTFLSKHRCSLTVHKCYNLLICFTISHFFFAIIFIYDVMVIQYLCL